MADFVEHIPSNETWSGPEWAECGVNARVHLGWAKFALAVAGFLLVAETLPASKKFLRSKSPRWALTVPYITLALGYVGTCVDFWMMTCLVRKSPSVESFIAGLAAVLASCVIAQHNVLDETRLEPERDRSVFEYILDATYRARLVWIEPTIPDSTGETAEGPQNVISKWWKMFRALLVRAEPTVPDSSIEMAIITRS